MSGGILGYVLRLGLFMVIGPIIGGLALVVGAALTGNPEALALVILLPLFLAGCYVAGWKAALLTGIIISLVGPQLGSRQTIVVVAALVGLFSSYLLPPGEGFIEDDTHHLLFSIAGAIAAAFCAWFLDRIKLMRPAESLSG